MSLLFFFSFRERVPLPKDEATTQNDNIEKRSAASTLDSPRANSSGGSENLNGIIMQNGTNKANVGARSLLKSASISGSKCVEVKEKSDVEVTSNFLASTHCLQLFFQTELPTMRMVYCY